MGHALEIILSATVLCDARGGVHGHRAIINRAKRFLRGDWVTMWAERKIRIRDVDDPAVQPMDKQLRNAVKEAMEEAEVGKFSDAMDRLNIDSLCRPSPDRVLELLEKHPRSDDCKADMAQLHPGAIQLDKKIFLKTIKQKLGAITSWRLS